MFLKSSEYNHVIDLLERKIKPPPLFIELEKWYETSFGQKLYGYICDHTSNGLIRLQLVLWGHEDKRRMYTSDGGNLDEEKQTKISHKFAQLAKSYNSYPEYQNPGNVFVCYETIEDEILKRILQKAEPKIKKIHGYDIWKIEIAFGSVHIFYETDKQIELHASDGVNDLLKRKISKIIRPYDKYGICTGGASCIFTSKQTFEDKYRNNMYYYLL